MRNTLYLSSHNNQQGIGLVEVMVALMLLAVAVLGFTAMQMTAVKATDESLLRTRALTITRGGAEMMRAYPKDGIPAFVTAVNGTASTVNGINKDSCLTTYSNLQSSCSVAELATRDGLALKDYAGNNGMQIAVESCPGTAATSTVAITSTTSATFSTGQARQCMIISWSSATAPTMSGANNACADTNGVYKRGVQCFIVEAY